MYKMHVNMKERYCYMNNNRRMFTQNLMLMFNVLAFHRTVWATSLYNITTCEEFENGAKFNPQNVVDAMWKIFYFWSDTSEVTPIIFSLLGKKRLDKIKRVVDAIDPNMGVEWHKATLLMEPRPGIQVVLMYAGTPGAFRALIKQEQRHKARPYPEPLIKFADVRMKVVGRYMGMMCCEDITAFALARLDEVPKTEEECETAAATLGLRGPGGRSYLYFKKKKTPNEL
ncbi:uncharacterized protein [Epargyreus clarus]|uniref:uncharacterized protein n=1 Tax=Epargyreus clarus TaxID=520877 RepID=UPI003C2F8A52